MRRHRPSPLQIVVLALLPCIAPAALSAQAVRVRVVEEGTGLPVVGALVALEAESGAALAEGISGSDGRRLLGAPAPGLVRVRVRRIGFAPYRSAPLTLAAGDTSAHDALVPARRTTLPTITVEQRARCGRTARGTAHIAAVWEEVRTALELSQLTRVEGATHVVGRTFERTLDERARVVAEQVSPPRTVAGRPFVARDVAELSALGYIILDTAETRYFAPDEQVLLSDAFADEHCFSLVRGEGESVGLVGLGFVPAPGRNLPDIAGTAWLDTTAAELRYVEFRFVPGVLPGEVVRDARGRVGFSRVADGRWIVKDWSLRMPRSVASREGGRTRVEFAGWRETGGVADATGAAAVALSTPGRLGGAAYDSLLAMPLVGTEVGLELADVPARAGGPLAVTATDSGGRYLFDGVPPGRWRVRLLRPDLDSAGLAVHAEETVAAGEETRLDLAVPSPATLRGSCPAGSGVIVGVIHDAESGAPFQGAVAMASWTEVEADTAGGLPRVERGSSQATTDASGTYRVCGVAAETATVQALAEDWSSGVADVVLGERRVARRNMTVSRAPGVPTAVLAGVVRDSAGAPVIDARVSVDGADGEAVTDSAGRFRLAALPGGTQNALVRALGYVPVRRTVELRRGDTTAIALALPRAQMLERVVVEGRDTRAALTLPDVERRRSIGQGYHIGHEELASLQTTRSIFALTPNMRISDARMVMGPNYSDLPSFLVLGRNSRTGEECIAHVFLDGQQLISHAQLQSVRPEQLVAVEVFSRRSQFPPDISPPLDGCGAVMLWTRLSANVASDRAAAAEKARRERERTSRERPTPPAPPAAPPRPR